MPGCRTCPVERVLTHVKDTPAWRCYIHNHEGLLGHAHWLRLPWDLKLLLLLLVLLVLLVLLLMMMMMMMMMMMLMLLVLFLLLLHLLGSPVFLQLPSDQPGNVAKDC